MVTRSHLVSLLSLVLVAAALVIATIYVANPQNINRILNIAMNDQGGGGGGGSGGQTKSGRCPDGTFAPDGDLKYCKGGKKKVKAKKQTAAKKPKTAKSEKDCGKNELYFTDSYGNKKCYPLGFKIQAGYVVCKNSTYGWMDICKDSNNDGLNDVTKPPPAPEKSTSCTFTGYNNQNYTIGQGQSVISNTASPFACIGGQLIECTKVTQQELNKFPSLGDCKSPTIAPSNTSYSGGNPAKASCYSNGLLLSPNDLNFTSNGWQQCVNGQMAASPHDPDTVAKEMLAGDDTHAEWLKTAAPETYQNIVEMEMEALYSLTTQPDRTYQIQANDTEFLEFCAANNITFRNPITNPGNNGCQGMPTNEILKQYCLNNGGSETDCAFGREFALNELTEYNPLVGSQAKNKVDKINREHLAEAEKLEQEILAEAAAAEQAKIDSSAMKNCLLHCPQSTHRCVLDAQNMPQCVDANIGYNPASLGTNQQQYTFGTFEAEGEELTATACGGSNEVCCNSGSPCNTGMACGASGKCEYDSALAKSTAKLRLIEANPTNFGAIIANNSQDQTALAKLNEAAGRNIDCEGTLTYSDTAKDFICITDEVLEQAYYNQPPSPVYPDSGNLNQACRYDWGRLNFHACNNDMLTCSGNNTCQLNEAAKNSLAGGHSQLNLATINSPGLALSQNVSLAKSGCTESKTAYIQNGQAWVCWDAESKIVSRAPSLEYAANPALATTLFTDVKNSEKAILTTTYDQYGVVDDVYVCPDNLVRIELNCVDPKVAAFDDNYSQGVFASELRENEVINQIPGVNLIVDHLFAPIAQALSPSYYKAAKTQAETAFTMLANSDATVDEVMATLSPAARVLVTTQASTVFEWHEDKSPVDNLLEIRDEALYHTLAGTSLFTSAWTESGFTGPEQSSFLNYASGYAGAQGNYWKRVIDPQGMAGAAAFGGEITMAGADFIPVDKLFTAAAKATKTVPILGRVLNAPHALQLAFDATRPGRIVTGLMEMGASPLIALGGGNIRPVQYFTHGLGLVTGKVSLETGQEVAEKAAKQGFEELLKKDVTDALPAPKVEAPAPKKPKLTANLPDEKGIIKPTEIPEPGNSFQNGNDTYFVAQSSQGTVYVIGPTGAPVPVSGSSNLFAQAQEAFDKALANFTGKYDNPFSTAADALADIVQRNGGNLDFLNNARRIIELEKAGIPVYMIDDKMLGKLDAALEKTLAEAGKTADIPPISMGGLDIKLDELPHYLQNTGELTNEGNRLSLQLADNVTVDIGFDPLNSGRLISTSDDHQLYVNFRGNFLPVDSLDIYNPGVELGRMFNPLPENPRIRIGNSPNNIFTVARSPKGPTFLINETTLERIYLPGSSNPFVRLTENISTWFNNIPAIADLLNRTVYTGQIDRATQNLIGLSTELVDNGQALRSLLNTGYPPHLLNNNLISRVTTDVNTALAAAGKLKNKITYTIDEMLTNGANPHILDNGHYVETNGIQTIKTSEISSINSHLNTDATDQGLTVNDIRELIRNEDFRWNLDETDTFLPFSNKDPIVAFELPDGTYHIEAGRHRAEALVRENIEEMDVRLWQLDNASKKIDIPPLPAEQIADTIPEFTNVIPTPFRPTEAPISGNFDNLGGTRYRIEIEGRQTVDIHINNDQIDNNGNPGMYLVVDNNVNNPTPLRTGTEVTINGKTYIYGYNNGPELWLKPNQAGGAANTFTPTNILPNSPIELVSKSPFYVDQNEANNVLKFFEENYKSGDPRFSRYTAGLHADVIGFEYNGIHYVVKLPSGSLDTAQLYSRSTIQGQNLALNQGMAPNLAPTTFLLDKDGRPIGIQRFVEGNTYYLNNTPQADLAVRTLKEKGVGITDPKGNIVHSANGPIIIDQEGIFLIDESKLVIAQHPEIAPYYTQWFSLDEAKEFAKKAGVPLVAAAPTGNWFDNNVYNTQNGLFPKWTTWKKPILITAGVGAAAWIGDQLDIFDPLIEAIKSFFNPQPAPPTPVPAEPGTPTPPAPGTPEPAETQEPPENAAAAKTTPTAGINGYTPVTTDNASSEIAVQAVFLQDLIIDFYHNPQNCTDTSQQCRETFSAYLKSNINSQHPELWEQPNFQYGFDSLIGGYGDYNQAIQCVVWDIALKGLGVNTAPISGMLGEKANDIYDVLVESNPSLNMSTTDFANLAQANASLNNNYTYGAGGNTLHLFNNFDSLQPSDCFFYGSGVGHTGCIIDVINNASGETLLVVSESNSPVNGTPTGLPETYYLTEADWGKKIGAAFQSVWFLRPK